MEEAKNAWKLTFIRKYREKIEEEMTKLCNETLRMLDEHLLERAKMQKPRLFYLKTKADIYRYLAECVPGERRQPYVAQAEEAYTLAASLASSLPNADPLRLAITLNNSVFTHDILGNVQKAQKMVKECMELISAEISIAGFTYSQETAVLIQLLAENSSKWSATPITG